MASLACDISWKTPYIFTHTSHALTPVYSIGQSDVEPAHLRRIVSSIEQSFFGWDIPPFDAAFSVLLEEISK